MAHASEVGDAFARLADGAAGITLDRLPSDAIEVLERAIFDSFGVALAGARTAEFASLTTSWSLPSGESSVWGAARRTDPHTAALLVGTAVCSLELDEGNKAARGHPGAHVIPAAVAEAERLRSSGRELLEAILAGYEVATRIATAFTPRQGLHPHGHWGAIGAAVAVGRLYGLDARGLAESMDAAAGLALAAPFSSALEGSFVRNLWVGTAGASGITAARLAMAGLGSQDATAASTFGSLLGELDVARLDTSFGSWTVTQGYFKRHSSCAYTHPPADAALALRRERPGLDVGAITSIRVGTHSLAAPLNRSNPTSRLAAMFSVPHVVAVALREGAVLPASFDEASLADGELARLRELTTVTVDPELDGRLPLARGARVEVTFTDGSTAHAEVPNAVGDSDYFPLGTAEIAVKLSSLIGDDHTATVANAVSALRGASDVRDVLENLSSLDLISEG